MDEVVVVVVTRLGGAVDDTFDQAGVGKRGILRPPAPQGIATAAEDVVDIYTCPSAEPMRNCWLQNVVEVDQDFDPGYRVIVFLLLDSLFFYVHRILVSLHHTTY